MIDIFKKILKKLYKYWMKFAHVLGTINGFIILFVFYFVIIGLYSVVEKIINLLFGPQKQNAGSYWQKKAEPGEGMENLKYQF